MVKKMGPWSVWVVGLVVLALIVSPVSVNGFTCSDAVNALIPCGSFLIGGGPPKPSTQCCTSAQSLSKLASTKPDRIALCECLKKNGPSFGVKPQRAKLLPSACKLQLNIPVSPTVNCKNI